MVRLSASRIDTLKKCSWLYYCKYILKLPDTSNDGSSRGTVTHNILELLLKDKHRHHYDKITEEGSVFASEAVRRLVFLYARPLGVDDDDNIELIQSFIMIGLSHDFFCEESDKLMHPEHAFYWENKDPLYTITGFIDKMAFYPNKIKVVDYKTSKEKYKGGELTFNTQALVYSIAAHKEWPEYDEIEVEFLFLKFPRKPSVICRYTREQIEGAESYLNYLNDYLTNYTKQKAVSDFAYDKGYPTDNTFNGKLVCGGKKGELKKDGNPKWICKYKYPFDYYVLVDGKGKEIDKDFDFIELQLRSLNLDEEHRIITKHYTGCPRFKGYLF